ncbi:MAG: LysR family transcriptional regulator [Kordiimonadaceae bacterium]|nr:LysR family transcriptional regulator [Kordiimonadaceae bacterium]
MNKELDLNFKLLAIFDSIMRSNNISQSAYDLGISQSAVSNQLAKLRASLGDKLFVRTSHGVLPTPFAESLHPYVCDAMDSMKFGIQAAKKFDLSQIERNICLIMTDIGEVTILPKLIKVVSEVAPGISLRTVNLPPSDISEALKSGMADLAVAFITATQPSFFQRSLFSTDYICIARRGHPFTKKEFTKRDFEQANHLVAEARGTGHYYLLEQNFSNFKVQRKISARVPNFMSMPYLVAETDLIATMPRKAAFAFRNIPNICILEHPIKLPTIDIQALWHERYNGDQVHMWLREQLYEIANKFEWDVGLDNLKY